MQRFAVTVEDYAISSNLVTDNRWLIRFVKPVSGLVVNKVNIAALENKHGIMSE